MFGIRSKSKKGSPLESTRRRGRRPLKLAVEVLEDRTLLSLAAPLILPTNNFSPEGIAVADLTGNGISDVVVANQGFSDGTFRGVSIHLGNGDGTFQLARTIDVGASPFAVAVGDFDNDGTTDLAVTHATPEPSSLNTITILLGNGDGTFRDVGDVQVGNNPRAIAVGDFLGNGKLDIVTANTSSNTVSVLLGNGDGTFQPAENLAVGPNPDSIAVGNFNGKLGIVVADEGDAQGNGGGVSILLGNGDGTFQPAVNLGLGDAGSRPAARAVAVADLTGSGILDIVTANDSDNGGTVSVFLGNGDGTFQNASTFPVVSAQFSNPLSLAVGDLHGNGRPDLVVGNVTFGSGRGNLDQLFLLAGNGNGTFQAPVALDAGMLPVALATGHFTSDGNLDLAAVNAGGGDVSILLGNGNGTFNTAPEFAVGSGASSVAEGDFTGSGILDLVTANTNDNTISVLLGNGDGTFQAPVTYAVGQGPTFVAVADLTGNGIQDIIVTNILSGTLSVLLGNGNGTFQAPLTFQPNGIRFFFPRSVAVGEFDGDNIPDLAVVNDAGAGNGSILILKGNGDGTFQQGNNLTFSNLSNLGRLAVADLNGDGKDDLVLPADSVNSGGVEVLLGNGDGTFRDTGFTPTTVGGASAVAVGDFGNGFPDLAVTNFLSNTVSVLLGNGSGLFLQPPVNYTVGGNPKSVLVAPLEGDGILDIVTANSTGNTVSVLRGNGDGTFQPEIRYLVGSGTNAVVAGDFNRDGALDLATANSISGNVSVLLNQNNASGPVGSAATAQRQPLAPSLMHPVGPGTQPTALTPLSAAPDAPLPLPGNAVPPPAPPVTTLDQVFAALSGEDGSAPSSWTRRRDLIPTGDWSAALVHETGMPWEPLSSVLTRG